MRPQGTPVLDIKPWVARFDRPYGLERPPRPGWLDEVDPAEGTIPAQAPVLAGLTSGPGTRR